MVKLRKQRRKKKYRHNVNRKRMRNKMFSTGNIACKEIKDEWDDKKSVKVNLESMGLSYDPNFTIKIPKYKDTIKSKYSGNNEGWVEEETAEIPIAAKGHVALQLQADVKAPRKRLLRLPKSQVQWLTYLVDKYGTDYKAMANDKKNYYQETAKQIRAKIKRFQGIPEQYTKYLEAKTPENQSICPID